MEGNPKEESQSNRRSIRRPTMDRSKYRGRAMPEQCRQVVERPSRNNQRRTLLLRVKIDSRLRAGITLDRSISITDPASTAVSHRGMPLNSRKEQRPKIGVSVAEVELNSWSCGEGICGRRDDAWDWEAKKARQTWRRR